MNEPIKKIFDEKKLNINTVIRNFRIFIKPTKYYNLDMIIVIGFRVKVNQGTKFRIWANEKEYLVKSEYRNLKIT